MSFHHYLNVYGPDDLLLYSSDPLPMDRVKLAKDIAQVGPADPEALGSYLLTHDQAQKIAGGSLKLAPGYSVLLEPIADDDTPSQAHLNPPPTTRPAEVLALSWETAQRRGNRKRTSRGADLHLDPLVRNGDCGQHGGADLL